MEISTKILIVMALISILSATAYCMSFIPGDGPVVAIERPDYSFQMFRDGRFE